MSDTETEQHEIQARVQQIFAHNTLPISDGSEVSGDMSLCLSHSYNSNLCFANLPQEFDSSVDTSYSETDPAGRDPPEQSSAPHTEQLLTPDEVGTRIQSAAQKYRFYPSNPVNTLESGHVARKVELFQEAQNRSRGGQSNSSRQESPRETNVSQLRAKFDPAPSTSPLPRKFSHPNPLISSGHTMHTPRANLETVYTASSAHNHTLRKFNYTPTTPAPCPRPILRRSKSVSPELPNYSHLEDTLKLSSRLVGGRSQSVSPKPRPRTRTAEITPYPAPRGRVEEMYSKPDTSHRRKRTLSSSSANHSPPKRPSLSRNSHTPVTPFQDTNRSPSAIHTSSASPNIRRSRNISMSPKLEISKQLMQTVRRSMSPEDLRELAAQYGQEETLTTSSLSPSAPPKEPPQNPNPYSRNRSFITALHPSRTHRPIPIPASDSISPPDTSIGFPHRIPRRSETSVSLHTPKVSESDGNLVMDAAACSSQTSIDTVCTDVSSSSMPTHCLTFSSGYNIQPVPPPAAAPPPPGERVMTRSATRESVCLKDRLGALRNQICLLEDGWRQATSALQICHMHGGMTGSSEEVEAERLLLNCSLRREAFFHEVKLLEGGYGRMDSHTSCTASLTLSGIRLSLSQQFMEYLTTRSGFKLSYHFVCVIKSTHPAQVVATHPLSAQPSVLNPKYNQLTFSDTLVLHCVREGFQLTPMVYVFESCRGKENANASVVKTPVSKVKRILSAAKSGSPLKRHRSLKKYKRKLPMITSETEIELKKTRFNLIASTSLDKKHLTKSDFRLDLHPCPVSPYPLVPILRLSVSIAPDLEQQEVIKGFLTIFHDDLTWNRRWCVLAHTTLSFWLYPEEEEQDRPPAGTICLQFINGEIESTNRIQCARINTFYFHCGRTRSKKYLISADSKLEKEKWMVAIRQVRNNIKAWI